MLFHNSSKDKSNLTENSTIEDRDFIHVTLCVYSAVIVLHVHIYNFDTSNLTQSMRLFIDEEWR